MGTWSGIAAAVGLLVAGGALVLGQVSAPAPAAPVLDTATAPAAGMSGPGAILATADPARSGGVVYDWPSGRAVPVLRAFEAPATRWAAGHRGVDLAVEDGAVVRAAADGVVAFAGRVVDRGVVSIDHADGVRTTYEPVSAAVRQGQRVAAGEVVGTRTGTGHCGPAPCLHWGARRGSDDYLDPMSLLREAPVIRLLPRQAGH